MIEHVYRGTVGCPLLDNVVIATCDAEIVEAAGRFGARAILTSLRHERASDRVAEANELEGAEIVVMVQGDEPMVRPEMVTAAVTPLLDGPGIRCVNLTAPIDSEYEMRDPNTIKVVMSREGLALYFSRSPIPAQFRRGEAFKQVCVIAFRRDALQQFAALPPGPLEKAESVDMLRFLEHGVPVKMVLTETKTHAVDTPGDLARVAALMGLP